MVAETAKKFEALEAQAHKIMSVFIKAGHEAVAPAIIQPAGVFLDVIGETMGLAREDAYMFASLAVDMRVTQLVDGNKGIHAMLPKSIFR